MRSFAPCFHLSHPLWFKIACCDFEPKFEKNEAHPASISADNGPTSISEPERQGSPEAIC